MAETCAFPECIAQTVHGRLCPVHQPEAIRERLDSIVLNHFGPLLARYASQPDTVRHIAQLRQDLMFDLASTI